MARTAALAIDNGELAEAYGALIEGIQKGAVSEQIKNTLYSGDPTTGSVEVDRFKNATAATYGTAREGGEGSKLNNAGKVTVNIDTDKEIIEELENKDIQLFGLPAIIDRRVANHVKRMVADLDTAFFAQAVAAGTAVTTTETEIEAVMEAVIQSVETTTNDYVDGVDRDQIVLSLKPAAYGKLRNYIDHVSAPSADNSGAESIDMFHGVRVFSNHRQSVDVVAMIEGAIAQPVLVNEYDAEKIGLSNAYAVELFYSYGTKAVTPDLIKTLETLPA
ncbi:hypothetical protein LJC07_04735 [Christensenellaceae bacterium OttesenSCG-928-L17]|nr:hypothetical protein [Christensenellaceae bacterium OttesenSCG-928-L17]